MRTHVWKVLERNADGLPMTAASAENARPVTRSDNAFALGIILLSEDVGHYNHATVPEPITEPVSLKHPGPCQMGLSRLTHKYRGRNTCESPNSSGMPFVAP